MALTPGTHLGPHKVTAQIGVGGMGEVRRATDAEPDRDVAISAPDWSWLTDHGGTVKERLAA